MKATSTAHGSRRWGALGALVGLALAVTAVARADDHIVRPGESLPQLAEQLYGNARRAEILAVANGVPEVDEVLRAGQRMVVPAPEWRTVGSEDTWASLAQRLLGDERRAFLLVEANRGNPDARPAAGTEILVPAVVAYRCVYGDGLPQIAERFYGRNEAARLIKRYNFLQGARIDRGDVLLLPLPELRLTNAGRALLESQRSSRGDGSRLTRQTRADTEIRTLEQRLRDGAFVEVIEAAGRLLAARESLSGNQVVSILRAQGTAYVALDRGELAVAAFREALAHQPDLEWNPITTSPKVLRAWQSARAPARPAPAPAKVPGKAPAPAPAPRAP